MTDKNQDSECLHPNMAGRVSPGVCRDDVPLETPVQHGGDALREVPRDLLEDAHASDTPDLKPHGDPLEPAVRKK